MVWCIAYANANRSITTTGLSSIALALAPGRNQQSFPSDPYPSEFDRSRARLVLGLLGALGLGGTAELLGAVLALLACIPEENHTSAHALFRYPDIPYPEGKEMHTLLSAGLLDLLGSTDTDETVMRLELLQGFLGVVDEGEASALATTVLRTEAKDGDLVLVGLVQVGELAAELILGDVGAVGVEDVTANHIRDHVQLVFLLVLQMFKAPIHHCRPSS